jgi:hypothetical protein
LALRWLRQAQLSHWQTIALLAWGVVTLLGVGRVALASRASHRGCYPIFSEAGEHWIAGKDLYLARDGLDVFRYHPLVAVFFVPLAVLPAWLGNGLLRLANVTLFLGGLLWWSRAGLPRVLTSREQALLFLLALPLAAPSLLDVQMNGAIVGLLLLGVTAVVVGRWNLASLGIGLACVIKAYPISLALLLIALYPRRFAARFLLVLAACLALPFLLQGPTYVLEQYHGWVRWGLRDRQAEELATAFRDLRLLFRVWLVPLSPAAFRLVQLGAGGGIALFCLFQQARALPCRRVLTSAFGLSCGWMTLLGPATEACTYIFLAPMLAWVLVEGWTEKRSRWYRTLLLASFALFAVPQLALWFPWGTGFHQLAPHPLAGLMLMAAVLGTEIRNLQQTNPRTPGPALPAAPRRYRRPAPAPLPDGAGCFPSSMS